MPLLDFLFEGDPPPQATRYESTSANLPDWYAAYTQGLLAKSNAIAAEPYQTYMGPRIAGLTPDQSAAFDKTRQVAGSTAPMYDAAGNMISAAGNNDALSLARPGINAATSKSAVTAADPYLKRAGETFTGSNVDAYMDPYRTNVTDRIAELGNRNLMERVLPGISDQFVAAGQLGSTRNSEFMSRAVRDSAGEIAGAQAGALSQGYQNAAQNFGTDAGRAADVASKYGSLTTADQGALLKGAELTGDLGGSDAARRLDAGRSYADLATARQGSGLKDAAALEAIGKTQQGQAQQNLDLAYESFSDERDFPKEQTDYLNRMIRGLQVPTASTLERTGPLSDMMGPSPLGQLAGAATGVGALMSAFNGKKRGGRIAMAHGGRVRPVRRGALTMVR